MEDHDWHLFDVENNYEVRKIGEPPMYEIRRVGAESLITTLRGFDFERLRRGELTLWPDDDS